MGRDSLTVSREPRPAGSMEPGRSRTLFASADMMDVPGIVPDEIIPALERRVVIAQTDASVSLELAKLAPSTRARALADRARDEYIAASALLVMVKSRMAPP